MKAFLDENYSLFISKIKDYISAGVKKGSYATFWSDLDIKLQIEPQPINVVSDKDDFGGTDSGTVTSCVKSAQALDGNNIDGDGGKTLIGHIKLGQAYWVINGRAEAEEPEIDRSDIISREGAEVISRIDIGGVNKYKLTWFVTGKKGMNFVKQNIAGAMLEVLKKSVKESLEVFETASVKSLLEGTSFMEQYYEEIKNQFNLPDMDLISAISYRTYESRKNEGVMCFVSKEHRGRLQRAVEFSESSIDEKGLAYDNEDYIRKMLEMSKQPGDEENESKWLLFDPGDKKCWGIILGKDIQEQEYLSVHFQGPGKWTVRYRNETALRFKNKELFFEENSRNTEWGDKLLQLVEETEGAEMSFFEKLIACLEEQKHGALVIIAPDAEKETERLCDRFKRGTRILVPGKKTDLLDREDILISMISGFCSIDGAVFIDWEGNCYGYGVILDGEAKIPGERGLGARHNSAANYVFDSQRYAIVVSEDKDKGIEFIDPKVLKQKLEPSQRQ